jgi:hypothetical protein
MNFSTGCKEIEPASPLLGRFAGFCLFHIFLLDRHTAFELDLTFFVPDLDPVLFKREIVKSMACALGEIVRLHLTVK